MFQTQHEQIQSANYAYILSINNSPTRFAIYLQTGKSELSLLRPGKNEKRIRVQYNGCVKYVLPLLPYQIESKSQKLPTFHFYLNGSNINKADELRKILLGFNPALEVRKLVIGWDPRTSMNEKRNTL